MSSHTVARSDTSIGEWLRNCRNNVNRIVIITIKIRLTTEDRDHAVTHVPFAPQRCNLRRKIVKRIVELVRAHFHCFSTQVVDPASEAKRSESHRRGEDGKSETVKPVGF